MIFCFHQWIFRVEKKDRSNYHWLYILDRNIKYFFTFWHFPIIVWIYLSNIDFLQVKILQNSFPFCLLILRNIGQSYIIFVIVLSVILNSFKYLLDMRWAERMICVCLYHMKTLRFWLVTLCIFKSNQWRNVF